MEIRSISGSLYSETRTPRTTAATKDMAVFLAHYPLRVCAVEMTFDEPVKDDTVSVKVLVNGETVHERLLVAGNAGVVFPLHQDLDEHSVLTLHKSGSGMLPSALVTVEYKHSYGS